MEGSSPEDLSVGPSVINRSRTLKEKAGNSFIVLGFPLSLLNTCKSVFKPFSYVLSTF